MIELRKLRELVKLMKEDDLSELDLRDESEQVTLRRPGPQAVPVVQAPPAAPPPATMAEAAAGHSSQQPPAQTAADQGLVEITSPMVGTFYSASSPDAEPFVRLGADVEEDTVVCIIEAMKVFNEIKAETRGAIEKVLVTSGQAVEYGQPLFLLRPA